MSNAGTGKRWMAVLFVSFLSLGLFMCLGCLPFQKQPMPTFDFDRDLGTLPSQHALEHPEEGSLWSEKRSANPYSDVKARTVGDIVTVSIVESARASKNATTRTERESELGASWTGLFKSAASKWSIHGTPIGTDHSIKFSNNFDGEGETTRESTMIAYITARVIRVLPNGHLVIRGSREVRLNNETQFISLQGVVRPEDISSNNVVLSTYIADARIELAGYGAVSDKQRPGWLARILDLIWPF